VDRETSRKHQGPVSVEALWGGFGELTRQFLAIMAAPLPIPTSPHLAGQTDATQGHQAEAGRLGSNRLEIDASGAICAPFSKHDRLARFMSPLHSQDDFGNDLFKPP